LDGLTSTNRVAFAFTQLGMVDLTDNLAVRQLFNCSSTRLFNYPSIRLFNWRNQSFKMIATDSGSQLSPTIHQLSSSRYKPERTTSTFVNRTY
jgi:hypothetical protein